MAKTNSAKENETTIKNTELEQTVETVAPKTENKVPSFENKREYVLTSKKHIDGKVSGSTGIITFDKNGNATVNAVEAEHFAKIPGYTVKEK